MHFNPDVNRKLTLRVQMYKVRLNRANHALNLLAMNSESPRSKLRQEMKDEFMQVSPETRRRLLYGKTTEHVFKETWNAIRSRKVKR